MWVKEPFFVFKQMCGVCVCVCVCVRARTLARAGGGRGCWWWDVNPLSSFKGGVQMHMHLCEDILWQGGIFLDRAEDVWSA